MNPTFSDIGIIIKCINFGEADKLVGIVTEDHGMVELVAKGARRIASRKASHLDLLNLVRFQVARGRAPQILTQADLVNDFQAIKGNLRQVRTVLYISELLSKLLGPDLPDKELYISLKNYLTELVVVKDPTMERDLSVEFQVYLMAHLGFPVPESKDPLDILHSFEDIIAGRLKSTQIKLS